VKTRAITALFFVLVMLGSFYGGGVLFILFYGLLALACLWEFYGLFDELPKANFRVGMIGGIVGISLFAAQQLHWLPQSALWALLLLPPFILYSQLPSKHPQPFQSLAIVFLGWIYALLPFIAFMLLGNAHQSFSSDLPLGFLLILWTSDTGAYLSGRAFGKHKLWERISPKKTWEGFVGGIVLAQITAYLWSNYTAAEDHGLWIIIALIVAIGGTYGDLVESMLKRSLHKKDSGNLLPGHGGLLDRFDGLLLAAPLVYVALQLLSYV
jgi:phosphatidate cytidylyltransferase